MTTTPKAAHRAALNDAAFRVGMEATAAALRGDHAAASQLYHRAGTLHGLAASDRIEAADLAAVGLAS